MHPYGKHRTGGAKAKALLKSYRLPDFNANGVGQPMVPKTPMAPPQGPLGDGIPGIPAMKRGGSVFDQGIGDVAAGKAGVIGGRRSSQPEEGSPDNGIQPKRGRR